MATLQSVPGGYTGTTRNARQLLDSLILYRVELGDTGRQLELLLRMYGVTASSDLPCPKQIH